jgi:hypothetical protein
MVEGDNDKREVVPASHKNSALADDGMHYASKKEMCRWAASPVIECVFPLPVWPYAKTVPLIPSIIQSTSFFVQPA